MEWISKALAAAWAWLTGKDAREGKAFDQSMQLNAMTLARITSLENGWMDLVRKDAEQQRSIDECRDKHEECDEDRKRIAKELDALKATVGAQIRAVAAKVTDVESKLSPGNGN